MTIKLIDKEILPTQDKEDVVLSVRNVSKKFCRDFKKSLFYGFKDIGRELIGLQKHDLLRKSEFWALKDINLELKRGEALGLVGPNGSGKSTLLRIIAGLIKPDQGSVEITGRVAPLIALGAGFNGILSGRENIYANMSILGLSKQEIDERFEEVVEFAEIPDAINAPVQSYSSGMAARLGFSCAIHTNPDILLIDEVLAVGDIKFRSKCRRKLVTLQENGTAFVMVSHNPLGILTVCSRAVYILNGKHIITGNSHTVMDRYEADLFSNSEDNSNNQDIIKYFSPQHNESGFDITSVSFKDENGNVLNSIITGQNVSLCITAQVYRDIEDVRLSVNFFSTSLESEKVLRFDSKESQDITVNSGLVEFQLNIPFLGIREGLYCLKLVINQGNLFGLDELTNFVFKVKKQENKVNDSLFYLPGNWSVKKQ